MSDKAFRARNGVICGAIGAAIGQGDVVRSIIMGLIVGAMAEGAAWVVRRMSDDG
jgi:hypothetical protein